MGFEYLLSQIGYGPVILIVIGILIFAGIFIKSRNSDEEISESQAQNIISSQPVINTNDNEILDEELVAVITAAIAASLNTTTNRLRIKSLKRSVNWKNAARQDSIY